MRTVRDPLSGSSTAHMLLGPGIKTQPCKKQTNQNRSTHNCVIEIAEPLLIMSRSKISNYLASLIAKEMASILKLKAAQHQHFVAKD